MSYIEKEKLIKADIASIENRVRHAFNQGYDLGFKEGKERAKPLEQEPKTGHWVHGEYCSECGCDVPAYIIDWKWQKDMNAKYCPNCGAKMVEPQESENI